MVTLHSFVLNYFIEFTLLSFMLITESMSSSISSPQLGFPSIDSSAGLTVRVGRQRSSSLVKVEQIGENSQEEALDENVYDNVNAEWVNRKGKFPSPFSFCGF